MKKTKLCIIFGGKSTEYGVSLVSASAVIKNADAEKYEIIKLGITRDGRMYVYTGGVPGIENGVWCDDEKHLREATFTTGGELISIKKNKIKREKPDVVFPVLHGSYGEDGRIQGMLDMCGIPYVGCGCSASAVCMDKAFAKMILTNAGIPMAKSLIVTVDEAGRDVEKIKEQVASAFAYPVFVKPSGAGSSFGVSKVISERYLESALVTAGKYCDKILIEEYIAGREVEVAVIGGKEISAPLCGEIVPDGEFYDYDAKYIKNTSFCRIPAEINDEASAQVIRYAKKIYETLGCRGFSRVDFFVREKNGKSEIFFNEINTIPGFTPISMFPKLFIHSGMTFSGIIDALVSGAK